VQTCLHGCFNQDKRSASVISTNTLDILVLIDTKDVYLESEGGRRRNDALQLNKTKITYCVKKNKKIKLCQDYHQTHGHK
jgi:hypothetical protein